LLDTPTLPDTLQSTLCLFTHTQARIQRFQLFLSKQTQSGKTEIRVIQIRQIASDLAKAAELRMDGSFEEPSAERFFIGKIGLVENLFGVMLAMYIQSRVQGIKEETYG
jgi:hypothetical protein